MKYENDLVKFKTVRLDLRVEPATIYQLDTLVTRYSKQSNWKHYSRSEVIRQLISNAFKELVFP